MFRMTLVGLVGAVLFGILGMLLSSSEVLGGIFGGIAIIMLVIAVICFMIGLIKMLFFD